MAAKSGRVSSKKRAARIVSTLLAIVSVCLFAYPAVTAWVAEYRQHDIVQSAKSVVDESDNAVRNQQLANAWAYNTQLVDGWKPDNVGLGGKQGTDEDISVTDGVSANAFSYADQLKWKPTGVIALVEIPKIGVELPVYHGTGDDALSIGAGHLESSTLPVGGSGSHCAISGHSAFPTARMFDDIRKLKVGDKFVIWCLGDAYAYQVSAVHDMVEPDKLVYMLDPEPGRDLVSLFTCTPYGVNSHRYVVTGERIPYVASDDDLAWNGSRAIVNDLTLPFMIVAIGLAIAGGVVLVRRLGKRPGRRVFGNDNSGNEKG